MTTLTAAPGANGAVTIAWAAMVAGGITQLTRTDANGTRNIRGVTLPVTVAGSVTDHEAAAGVVTYRATASDGVKTAVVPAHQLGVAGAAVVATVVEAVRKAASVELILSLDFTRSVGTVVHHVLNRADPITVPQLLRMRTGRLELLCATWASVLEVFAVYTGGRAVLLRQATAAGLDLYHVPSGELTARTERGRWVVTVGFAEVTIP